MLYYLYGIAAKYKLEGNIYWISKTVILKQLISGLGIQIICCLLLRSIQIWEDAACSNIWFLTNSVCSELNALILNQKTVCSVDFDSPITISDRYKCLNCGTSSANSSKCWHDLTKTFIRLRLIRRALSEHRIFFF